jgi:hypothetical protein
MRERPQAGQRNSKHHSSDFEIGGLVRFKSFGLLAKSLAVEDLCLAGTVQANG